MQRDGTQQALGIGMQWVFKELIGRGFLHDLPAVHHQHAGTRFRNHSQIVGYQHNRGAYFFPKVIHEIENLRLNRHIERSSRFIGDQQRGFTGEGHGNHCPLPHPAAKLVGITVHARFGRGDTHQIKHFNGARKRLFMPFGMTVYA